MHKQIYVNLAVNSVEKSKAFFSQLGFTFEPKFTNEQAACMVIGENIYAMLLAKDFSRPSRTGRCAIRRRARKR